MKDRLMLTTALAALLTLTASCSLSASPGKWDKFSFNGQAFQPGGLGNRPSVWIRDGYIPRVEEPGNASRDSGKLPPKAGAVAGLCYVQTSGGKLADQSGSRPLPDELITIKSSEYGVSVTRSDAAGFFIEELFPGDYQFFCRGAGVEVRGQEGTTVLVPIRGAKRMAD
jgi:hypothetical protein